MHVIRVSKPGGPEALEWVEQPLPEPGPGEIRVRHTAIGLNFIDTYQRSGLYPLDLPAVLGREAAGLVDAVGEGVTRFRCGQRVAYNGSQGAYAQFNVVPEDRAVALPEGIDDRAAAAALLKGLTAEFLIRRTWPLAPGDVILVLAAAGGVGSLLCQWARHLELEVIGAVGSADKVEKARVSGCAHVLRTDEGPLAPHVRALTQGRGAKVVYDSVGRDSFDDSLAAVARRGLLVSFGNASGPVAPVAPARLNQAGSVFLTRPSVYDYIETTEALDDAAAALFDLILRGVITVDIGQTFPLSETRRAHEALEARRTTGSTLLIP